MAMGTPVVSLSLSPAMEMLATAHVNRRGIYLWANQLVFGIGSTISPSDTPVRVCDRNRCRQGNPAIRS
jgi:U3 small nucleolar RNA-associated protein 21